MNSQAQHLEQWITAQRKKNLRELAQWAALMYAAGAVFLAVVLVIVGR